MGGSRARIIKPKHRAIRRVATLSNGARIIRGHAVNGRAIRRQVATLAQSLQMQITKACPLMLACLNPDFPPPSRRGTTSQCKTDNKQLTTEQRTI